MLQSQINQVYNQLICNCTYAIQGYLTLITFNWPFYLGRLLSHRINSQISLGQLYCTDKLNLYIVMNSNYYSKFIKVWRIFFCTCCESYMYFTILNKSMDIIFYSIVYIQSSYGYIFNFAYSMMKIIFFSWFISKFSKEIYTYINNEFQELKVKV